MIAAPGRSDFRPADQGGEAPPLIVTGQAFPKHLRLLRRAEFRRVYEEGLRRSTSLCTVFLRPNGLTHSRLGITVPTRVGNAVKRNRIKRRLREIFRLNRPVIPGGWDIVVNPRAQAAEAEFSKLAREFLRLLTAPAPSPGKPARS
jgi:ribonuclease P protein component